MPAKATKTSNPVWADIREALRNAKAQMPELVKDSKNSHFKNTYLSLNGLLPVIMPVLAENDIDVIQTMDHVGEQPALRTEFYHWPSGTSIEGLCPMALARVSPQDVGSATTYYRRYALMAGLNLLAEDDDGNRSSLPPSAGKMVPSTTVVSSAKGIGNIPLQPWEK